MAQPPPANAANPLELRFKRWTAVAVVCFLGLIAALPFRSAPPASHPTVAPSHRERSLRFRADSTEASPPPPHSIDPRPAPSDQESPRTAASNESTPLSAQSPLVTKSASRAIEDTPLQPMGEKPLETVHSPPEEKSVDPAGPLTHCIAQQGETLMDIAERALGDRSRWRELAKLNPTIRSGFDAIPAGEEILLREPEE